MEEIIKKIISIDKKAENDKKQNSTFLEEEQKSLDNSLEKLRSDWNSEIVKSKDSLLSEIMSKSDSHMKQIEENKNFEVARMDSIFKNIKDTIVNEAFNNVVNANSNKGD